MEIAISPLADYGNLIVPQKCLLPSRDMPAGIRCGAWVKCIVRNSNDVICQVYTFLSEQSGGCAYMDQTVTIFGDQSNSKKTEGSILVAMTPLRLNNSVESIEVVFVVSPLLFNKQKKAPRISTLEIGAKMLLQAFGLTANCTIRSQELIKSGIDAIHVKAIDCENDSYYYVTDVTSIKVVDICLSPPLLSNRVRLNRIFHTVGFETPLLELNDLLEQSRRKCSSVCLNALIVGPSGCGKSALLSYFIRQNKCNYFLISTADVMGQYPGETEEKLRDIFRSARCFVQLLHPKAPTVIIFEDIHLISPAVKADSKDAGNTLRACAQLCALLDDLHHSKINIIFLATTSVPDSIHKSLRSPGRLQHEISVDTLTARERKFLFKAFYEDSTAAEYPLTQYILESIAAQTAGYVAADLALLVRCIEQEILRFKSPNMTTVLANILKKSKPASLRSVDVTVHKSEAGFNTIGGMQTLKTALRFSVLFGLERVEAYRRLGLNLPKGILLYGPPGCAKTTIAKCLAAEAKMTFIATSGAEVYSPYVGCAEKFLKKLFDAARKHAPCLIFLDEIDSLVGCRTVNTGGTGSTDVQTRILSTLLTEMDGIIQTRVNAEAYILVVAATNRPHMIDEALLRPGRFDKLIHVPTPDQDSRLSILELYKEHMPFAKDCNLKEIAERTQNFSGADICNLCNEAAMKALHRHFDANEITNADFENVLRVQKSSLSEKQIDSYFEFAKHRQS